MEGNVTDYKGRNNLIAVKHYLQHGCFPKDCRKDEKRSVRKRSQTFVFRNNTLYYTGGRHNSKAPIITTDGEGIPINIEDESDGSKALRECCTTEEERQAAVMRCHIGEDGNHFGIEKTTERVSKDYYWVGIIGTVKKVLHNCDFCLARGIRCTTGVVSTHIANHVSNLMTGIFPAAPVEDDTPADDLEPAPDDSLVSEPPAPTALVKTESQTHIVPLDMIQEPDVFAITEETISYFWQKVEIQVFGPFEAGKKQVYVAVCLDCYSQFPEATVMDNISDVTLTTFVMNLICRYGVMEKLCMLQNRTTKNTGMYVNIRDLETADLSPIFLTQQANPADERWQRVSKNLEQFIESHPKSWVRCLEAFMVPLRISLPPLADYAPAYLTYNREPVLPEKISHKSDSIFNSERSMSEEEERQTVDVLVAAFGKERQIVPTTLDISIGLLPNVKLEPLTTHEQDMLNLEESTIIPVNFDDDMKQGQGKNTDLAAVIDDINDAYGGSTDDEANNHYIGSDLDNDRDESYQPGGSHYNTRRRNSSRSLRSSNRKRTLTFKAEGLQIKKEKRKASPQPIEPTPPKRKRGRPPKNASLKKEKNQPRKEKQEVHNELGEDYGDDSFERADQSFDQHEDISLLVPRSSSKPVLTKTGLFNCVEKLTLDLYYLIIKCYKERMVYPPRVSVDFKRAIRRLAETIVMKDGKMYGHLGKGKGRLIIRKERERFSLMRKAHVKGEEHYGRVKALKTLFDMKVYWKGIIVDVEAFVNSCPECNFNNPMRNKTVVKIPSFSKKVKPRDHHGDLHISEDEEEESSYEDLIQYLTDNTFPPTTIPEQQSRIQQRSQSFCIINGSLFYKSPARPKSEPRQVLFSEKTRQSAIAEAHVEDGNHLSQQDTQVKLRRQYFWSGMTYDILKYIADCCMTKLLQSDPIEHRNSAIQHRVNKFWRFYKEGIPDLVKNSDIMDETMPAAAPATEEEEVKSDEVKPDVTETEYTGTENTETELTGTENPATTNEVKDRKDNGEEVEEAAATPDTKQPLTKEDHILRLAMEDIIVKLGGEKCQPPKPRPAKKKKIPLTLEAKDLTVSQLRVLKGKTKHKCEHCGRIVKGDVAFRVHLYKHTGVKPFNCNVCGKSFSNRKSQRIHMRKHTGVRPYLCNQCGRDFIRSASLRYHLKAHATGKTTPVTCDKCGRSFSTQHRLLRHKEFKHPAQAKVFICNQCGKHFTAARSLKRHEQAHTGYRRYQCQYCVKSFFRKEYLNAHLVNHPEYEPELEKLKARKKVVKKPQQQPENVNLTTVVIPGPNDGVPSNIIHWTESEPSARRYEETAVTDLDTYQRQTVTVHPTLPSSHVTSSHISHLPPSSVVSAHSHTVHHTLHHPIAHTARLMNVAGHHGPLSLTVSSARPSIEVVHAGNGQEILLQHDAVPVQYEVECLSGEAPNFSEADLNAIHLLAQASISGQSLHTL